MFLRTTFKIGLHLKMIHVCGSICLDHNLENGETLERGVIVDRRMVSQGLNPEGNQEAVGLRDIPGGGSQTELRQSSLSIT